MRRVIAAGLFGAVIALALPMSAQDSLSAQVLRLLTRTNTWTGVNTFDATVGIKLGTTGADPTGGTANRLYNKGGSLFWNGAVVTTAAGVGTVTSVALTTPAIFSVAGSPVVGAGTLAVSLATQAANRVWAGPTVGADATPTFRAIVDADIPNTITIDSASNVTWASVNKTGSSLLDLATRSAADLTGTLPDASFPATLPAISGVNLTALSASNLGSGTLPCGRMAALTGDVTTTVNTCGATLAVTGVAAGAYGGAANLLSITVDAKGRITSLANVAASTHPLLSATHTDAQPNAVSRGAVIVGNSTPQWALLQPAIAGTYLRYDGADTVFTTDGSTLTSLSATNISAGILAVARGGTGVSSAAANGQLLIGNGTGFTLATASGTPNQVLITNAAGSITFALPQSIGTTSTPQLARLGLGTGADATAGLYLSGVALRHAIVDDGNCGAADTVDWSTGNHHKSTLSAATCVYTWTNPLAGSDYVLDVVEDGTGSRLVTWPTIKWAGGASPTLTTAATKIDRIFCSYDGTSYLCHVSQNF